MSRDTRIEIRVTRRERATAHAVAKWHGVTYSALVRELIAEEAKRLEIEPAAEKGHVMA